MRRAGTLVAALAAWLVAAFLAPPPSPAQPAGGGPARVGVVID
jgi:hypothetical protein